MKSISWEALREANFVVCVICVGLSIFNGPTWIGVLDGVIVGMTGGAVFYITLIIRMKASIADIIRAANAVAEMNQQLIALKAEIVLERDKERDGAAQSLH